jgi:FdhE protein
MPYVPIPPRPRAALLLAAEQRWNRIVSVQRELTSAVNLQRTLLTLVLDVNQTIASGRLPRLSLPPRYLAAKLGRGMPILAAEPIPLPVAFLKAPLSRICDELAIGGAGEAADQIRQALDDGTMDPGSLLAASFSRDQSAIRAGAGHRGLSPDLTWLAAELAVSPVAHALQHAICGVPTGQALGDALAAWNHGYCPACGSWPALIEVVDQHRTLRCSFCAAGWELTTYGCVYCGDDGEGFVTAAPDVDRAYLRVEMCAACGSYMKTIDLAELSPFPLVTLGDLESMEVDVAAMEHGYGRPPMKEFTPGRGSA